MHKVTGNLITMAKNGDFDVIVHGCNCFCTMGSGIALSIKEAFPAAYVADLSTSKGDESKLGKFSAARLISSQKPLTIVNAYTQYDFKGGGVKVRYRALRKAFRSIKEYFSGKKIGYPLIGAGLAGGDWDKISTIIDQELEGEDHTLVEWDGT